jgi:hypothetical protein
MVARMSLYPNSSQASWSLAAVSKVLGQNIGRVDDEGISVPETETPAVWNLLAYTSAATPAVEACLSEKAAVALYEQ